MESCLSNVKLSRLQTWANDHQPSDQMLWKNNYWDQIMFVRDQVAQLLARTFEQWRDLVDVVSTHTSKSITCPVFYIDLPQDGVRIWMRYNFHDWNVSIESERPLTCNFLNLFEEDDTSYCFCQGMEDKKFESYSKNNRKFTVCLASKYDVYAFFLVLRNFLGIKKED